MMRTLVFPLAVLVFATGCGKSSSTGDFGRAAPATLSEWSWLPTTAKHDAEVAQIQQDSSVQFFIPKDEPLDVKSNGWGGITSTGEFIPTDKKSYIVKGGALVSKVGPLEKKAKWGDWDFVYAGADLKQQAGWGEALTGGEVILSRKLFLNIPTDKYVQNSFEIESFGERFVLIRLDPAKGHKLVFLKSGGSNIPTAGYIGSKAEVAGKILERRADGWYSGTTRLSK